MFISEFMESDAAVQHGVKKTPYKTGKGGCI